LRWMRQDSFTGTHDLAVDFPRTKTTVDQFHCVFSHEYPLQQQAPQVSPFIMASLGATNISSESNPGSTHLSVGVGGGVKFFVNHHWGFRMQAEWLPVFVGPRARAMCVPGCSLHLGGALVSQVGIAIGPVIRF
jgi:hypothetical protein